MDAVILAGGRGSRLDGIMPPYWKPLMPINGVPLVRRIYDQVRGYVVRTFVIVAPENALQVAQIMPNENGVFLVVQPEANGPGAALLKALALTRETKVLVVMGDNMMPDEDIEAIHSQARFTDFVIGARTVWRPEEAQRFTRIYDNGARIEEGPHVSPPDEGSPYTVWCGPLVLPVNATMAAIRSSRDEGEQKIGTHLGAIGRTPTLVGCSAVDIGTPDTIMEVQQ